MIWEMNGHETAQIAGRLRGFDCFKSGETATITAEKKTKMHARTKIEISTKR
jgi:hypothetical protein